MTQMESQLLQSHGDALMSHWKWWLVVSGLVASNAVGFGLFAFERGKHTLVNGASEVMWKRLADAETEAETLKSEKRQLVEKARDMTSQLRRRTVRAATRNASSVLAESVPYAGIAVMLAVTASDLHDACETMKEIERLHAAMGLETTETKDVCGMSVPSIKNVFGKLKKHCGKFKECDAPVTDPEDIALRARN